METTVGSEGGGGDRGEGAWTRGSGVRQSRVSGWGGVHRDMAVEITESHPPRHSAVTNQWNLDKALY